MVVNFEINDSLGLTMGQNTSPLFIVVSLLMMSSLSGCLSDNNIFTDSDNPGIPGGLTLACLDSKKYTSLVIEIDYENGYQPKSSSTDLLKQRLEQVCDKPDGITIFSTETSFQHQGAWTDNDVREKGWEFKKNDPQDKSILNWQIIFPSGSYSDESTLGVAVDASTIAIFGDSVEEAEGFFGRPSAEEVENSVIVHEVGHLLGLVNIVYQSLVDHEDPDHPHHSNNDESVMYWAIDSTSVGNFISGDLPDEFDQNDLDDLSNMKDGTLEVTNQLWTP